MINKNIKIIEKDIPIGNGCIDVIADGLPATIEITDEPYSSSKVLIKFKTNHKRWGDSFQTKYFSFESPGKMSWGHDGEVMKIIKS